jgi:hypothetical protein
MPWDPARWDHAIHGFVRDLVRIRKSTPALLRGGFQVLEAAPDSIAFLRDAPDSVAIVVVARGPDPRPDLPLPVAHGAIPDGSALTERLTGRTATVEDGRLDIGATPPGVAIWTAGTH